MKSFKKFILLILLINIGLNCFAQIQLLNIEYNECDKNIDPYQFKPIYKQLWLNDSTLQIKTRATSNCIGIYNPRINQHGPLVSLEFDEYKLDTISNKVERIAADCNCVYCVIWVLGGIKKDSDFIVILNDQISINQDLKTLDRLLKSYKIDDHSSYYYLRDVIDLNGFRQGIQVFRENNVTSLIPYNNNEIIK
jgi:hypothetical protein